VPPVALVDQQDSALRPQRLADGGANRRSVEHAGVEEEEEDAELI
jgi:hypothetical protein